MRRRAIYKSGGGLPLNKLVLYMKMNGDLTDSTGLTTFTNIGVTFPFAGIFGEGLSATLNATSDQIYSASAPHLSFGDGVATNQPFTIFTAINGSNLATSYSGTFERYLIAKREETGTTWREWQLTTDNLGNRLPIFTLIDEATNGTIFIQGSVPLNNSIDYFISASSDGTTNNTGLRLFINGVEDPSPSYGSFGSYNVMYPSNTSRLQINGWGRSSTRTLTGSTDQNGVFGIELTTDQHLELAAIIMDGNALI